MSGILGWASDALTSIIAPFKNEPPPRPDFQVPKARKVAPKKKAQAKRRQPKVRKPAPPGVVAAYEPDESTKIILQRMAEAAERRAAEEAAEEAAEAERLQARQDALANSIVAQLPADPLASERAATLADMKAKVAAVGCGENLKLEDFVLADFHSKFDNLAEEVEEHIRRLSKKTPRVRTDKQNATIDEMRTLIQNEELKQQTSEEGANDLEIASLVGSLTALISQQNQKKFQDDMYEVINDISSARANTVFNYERARENESKNRAVERLRILYDELSTTSGQTLTLDPKKVIGQSLDASFDTQRLGNLVRRLERKFKCVITRQRNTTRLWGTRENVQACNDWIRQCDWTGGKQKTYDRRISGVIIGRGGSTIQQIEEETNSLLNLDGNNCLTVYAPEENVQQVWDKVEEYQSRVSQFTTSDLKIDPRIGQAIMASHRPVMNAIEAKYEARITLLLQPDDGKPRILVRAPVEKHKECETEVRRKLVEGFTLFSYPKCSARAVSRLLIPPKSSTGRAQQAHSQFKTLQATYGVFVQREQNLQQPNSDEVGIWVVCSTNDKQAVQQTMEQLLEFADYTTERISIMREQQRVFNAENRNLIEMSSGCQVTMLNNPEEGSRLVLLGTTEQIARAKEIVEQILEEQGAVEVISLADASVIDWLLRDRATTLRSIEDIHAVSIHIDRERSTARLVGDRQAIEDAVKEIRDIEAEAQAADADTIKLIVTINGDRVPMLIGRGGQTIQQVRRIPGIKSVVVPNNVDPDVPAEVQLIGRSAAIEEARQFIEELVRRDTSSATSAPAKETDYAGRVGRGRGRRQAPAAAPASAAPALAQPDALSLDAAAFPPLLDCPTGTQLAETYGDA